MKKSKLLSVLTAGAVIATTVGTYAVWDDTRVSTTAQTVTFKNPVTVTVADPGLKLVDDTSILNGTPKVTGTVKFTVDDKDHKANKLTITPELTATGASIDDFDIVIKKKGSLSGLPGTAGAGFVDNSLETTEYTVEVTPNTDTQKEANVKNAVKAAEDITLKLTATLSDK